MTLDLAACNGEIKPPSMAHSRLSSTHGSELSIQVANGVKNIFEMIARSNEKKKENAANNSNKNSS